MLAKLRSMSSRNAAQRAASARVARRRNASIFASDDLIPFKLSARASRRYPNEDLQQQFPGNPVGVVCIGASELIGKGMQPDHIEPRDLRQHFEHRSIECEAAGIGELQSAPDTSVGQYRKRFRLGLREFRAVTPE